MDSKPAQAQTRAVAIPWLQAKLIQVRKQPVTEDLQRAHSWYLPRAYQCLHLKQQQEVLTSSSFLLFLHLSFWQ